jgi:hypothetical protein
MFLNYVFLKTPFERWLVDFREKILAEDIKKDWSYGCSKNERKSEVKIKCNNHKYAEINQKVHY